MFTVATVALSGSPCPATTAKTSHCDDHSARRGFSFISKGAARRQVPLFAIHRSANSDDGTGEMCLLNFELGPKTARSAQKGPGPSALPDLCPVSRDYPEVSTALSINELRGRGNLFFQRTGVNLPHAHPCVNNKVA